MAVRRASPNRTLDVLEILLRAPDDRDDELHGWAEAKQAHRAVPTVYRALDRLEGYGWIAGRWEIRRPSRADPGAAPTA